MNYESNSETSPQFSAGWIYNQKYDLVFFSGTLLFTCFLYFGAKIFIPTADGFMPEYFYLLVSIFADGAHGLTSITRIYSRSEYTWNEKILFTCLPFIIWLFIYIFIRLDTRSLNYFISYFAAYHFIRQQYGWFKITASKAHFISKLESTIDNIMIYNITLTPLIYWTLVPTHFGWYGPQDIFDFTHYSWLIKPLVSIHILICTIYILYQFKINQSKNILPWAKYQILIVTWLAWIPAIFLQNHIAKVLFFAIPHGIQYFVLTFYIHENSKQKIPHFRFLSFFKYYLAFIIIDLCLTFFDKHFFLELSTRLSIYSNSSSQFLYIVNIMQIWHFVVDGYIWKISRTTHTPLETLKKQAI